MDDARIGRALRELRRRRGLRQIDVAAASGLSQPTVSAVERGHVRSLSIGTVRRLFAAVDAGFEGTVLWRGGGIDRLLDARHSRLVGEVARRVHSLGWSTVLEATYSVYGERGSIDLLAAHDPSRSVAVVEVKSELTSLEELLRKTDQKVRLARGVLAQERVGWHPRAIGRLLVLPDSDASRRAVLRHRPVLDAAFPLRGRQVVAWLRRPDADMSGILFLSRISEDAILAPLTGDASGSERADRA